MTLHLGDVPSGSTLYIPFASYGGTNGESITLTGLAVTDIEIYKNGGTTQRASDAGYALLDTDGIDFDGITGIHGFSIDLSDNTDSGFFAVGSFYWVVVSSVTIDSQTVNLIAATFRIVAAESVTGKPKVDVDAFGGTAGTFSGGRPEVNTTHWGGTAVASAVVGANVAQISGDSVAADNAESFFDGTGYAGTNNVIPTVTTLTGHTAQTGDNYARLGAPAGASVSADIAAVKTDTGNLVSRITSTLFSGITSLAEWLGLIAGKQTGDATARTELRATGAGSGTYDETTDSLEAVKDAGVSVDLATFFSTNTGETYASAVAGSVVKEIADNAGGSSLTEAGIADAVWDEATSGHTTAGTFGKLAADVLADTNELQTNQGNWITATGFSTHSAADVWAVATRVLTAGTNIVLAKGTGVTGFNDLSAAQVNAEVDTALGDYDGPTKAELDSAFTEIKGATWATTDTLEAIRDRGDAAWVTATGFSTLDAAGIRTAIGLASANLDTQLAALPTAAENATAVFTTAMTESYRSAGAAGTLAQYVHEMIAHLGEFSISGTTKTLKKLDGSTSAKTYTLDDGTSPTSITEAT